VALGVLCPEERLS